MAITEFKNNPVVNAPCGECPWKRDSAPGWLGPLSADNWITLAHSDEPIACHSTIKQDDDWEGVLQCAGVARYRKNVCKLPIDPNIALGPTDRENIFANQMEFKEHHER